MVEKITGHIRFHSLLFFLIGAAVFCPATDAVCGILGSKVLKLFSSPAKDYDVTRASKELPIVRTPVESLSINEISGIRELFETRQFKKLNTALAAYQKAFDADSANEYRVHDSYRAFDVTLPAYESLLEKWVQEFPDVHYPYIAAAQYYYALAWKKRGAQYINKTPEENIRGMRFDFLKAMDHLKAASDIRSDLIMVHYLLLGIYNASGDDENEDLAIREALAVFPDSFIINARAAFAKQPRWGGSYRQMEEIAKNAESWTQKTPKLFVIYGFIYSDQGWYARQEKKYDKAVRFFEKALSYGDYWGFYYELAKVYHYGLKDFNRALDYIDKSIELRSTFKDTHRMRSRILFAQKRYSGSIRSLATAELLNPTDRSTEKWRQWAAGNLLSRGHKVFKTDLGAAVGFYDLSIEFNDDNYESYYWKGVALSRLNRNESALLNFKRAVRINPRHFESFQMIDYIYARDRKWDRIIGYWNRFLALEPGHAQAFFERSGTHYHNRDFKHALEDLKRSCELGYQKACKKYKQMKGVLY